VSFLNGVEVPIIGVDHIQLAMPVGQESEARAFYSGVLQLSEVRKPPALALRGGVWFENGKVRVHLGADSDFKPARRAHPGFLVLDLPRLAADLRDAGYEVIDDEPLDGYDRFFVNDPFGNRLEFLEPYPDRREQPG
jgi:catechol 2,3-dioxygenase-like lactoylglutathione lyase family enzyme